MSISPSACWRCRSSPTPRKRWSSLCRRHHLARNSVPTYVLIIVASLQLDFADLNGGLGVGVVGDIGKDRLRMRGKGGLKGVRRVEIEMPLRDIGRRHPGRAACDALFNRYALAGWAGRGAGP